jgi:hypothetical protein
MRTLSSYLEAKLFEDKIGDYLASICSNDEEIIKESFVSGRMMADFYLPNGCKAMQWPSKTVIEVKNIIRYSSISRIFQSYYVLFKEQKISQLVIIHNSLISNDSFKKYLETLDSKFIKIYNVNELVRKEDFLNKEIKEIPSKVDVIDKAKDAYNNMRYTFFLGAGLSMDAQLPSWSALLESLLKSENRKPFEYINNANSESISSAMGYSSIVTGRYALDGYLRDSQKDEDENYQDFIERIRKVLYKKKNYKSALITSVAKAVKRKKPAQIITYNYDDLLDELLNKKDFYSVSDNIIPRTKDVPIYHVHGMISRDNTRPSNSVLSEKDYHHLYSNPHNWANVVQLNALYTSVCFFIGFSMTDPNQRRLLELARAKDKHSDDIDKLPHFVFLKKEPLKGEASKEVNEEHWHEIEYMMSDFGLNVIWYNDFSDLPKMIDYISGYTKNKPQI